MRSPVTGIVALILLLIVAMVAYSSLFTVQQTEQALVVRFGKPVDIVTEPGLHVKAPFIDTVIPVDKRILDLENPRFADCQQCPLAERAVAIIP